MSDQVVHGYTIKVCKLYAKINIWYNFICFPTADIFLTYSCRFR